MAHFYTLPFPRLFQSKRELKRKLAGNNPRQDNKKRDLKLRKQLEIPSVTFIMIWKILLTTLRIILIRIWHKNVGMREWRRREYIGITLGDLSAFLPFFTSRCLTMWDSHIHVQSCIMSQYDRYIWVKKSKSWGKKFVGIQNR